MKRQAGGSIEGRDRRRGDRGPLRRTSPSPGPGSKWRITQRRSELGPAGAGIVVWPDGVKVLRGARAGRAPRRDRQSTGRPGGPRPGRSAALRATARRDLGPKRGPGLCREPDGAAGPHPRCRGAWAGPDGNEVHRPRAVRHRGDGPLRRRTRGAVAASPWGRTASIPPSAASWRRGSSPPTPASRAGSGSSRTTGCTRSTSWWNTWERGSVAASSRCRTTASTSTSRPRGTGVSPAPRGAGPGFSSGCSRAGPRRSRPCSDAFEGREPIYLEICDLPHLDRWSAGRVTLLGDAAHATTPTVGQGACQALEDVAVLVRCLESEPADVVGALSG